MNIPPSTSLPVDIQSQDEETRYIIDQNRDLIVHLARLKTLAIGPAGERPRTAATSVVGQATVFVSLEGLVDFGKEIQRIGKELKKVSGELKGVAKKLSNADFLEKARPDVVEGVREKSNALTEKQEKLQGQLDRIVSFERE